MITAVIDGHTYSVNDEDSTLLVGTGGEADVFRFAPNAEFVRRYGNHRFVLKIFREATTDAMRRAARERQTKLLAFPRGLPSNVIAPITLAYDHSGRVIGYVMIFVSDGTPLIRYKSAKFCRENSISVGRLLRIMTNLHDLVNAVHALGLVIGDFSDKNVLVLPTDEVCLLDADSIEFDVWECPAFTPAFVDPQIVELRSGSTAFRKIGRHSPFTDWYAFAVMLFQLLVRVHPYTDGFYPSSNGEGPIKGNRRIQQRISVFHPRVTLPNTATPLDQLPASLVACFRLIFEQQERGVIPRQLLNDSAATQPASAPPYSPPRPQPRPASTARILAVRLQDGQPRYVTYENGAYRREGGQAFWTNPYDPEITAIPAGNRTVMAWEDTFVVFDGGRHSGATETQMAFGRTTVAANAQHVYWLRGSELVRDARGGGVVTIGKIAPGSTSVWVGERFGVALVQAGILNRVLIFTEQTGFHSLTLPSSFGSVIDAQCVIGGDLAWLTLSIKSGGRVVNRCFVIDSRAQLQATASATQDDDTWLGNITPATHAVGSKLLVPVPRLGIVRVGIVGPQITQELVYPGSSKLVPNREATIALTYSAQGLLHFNHTSIYPVTTTL